MADAETVKRLALALPQVVPKKHFHLEGFAIEGKGFATIEKDGTAAMLSLDPMTAQQLADEHPHAMSIIRRNERPIGVRIALNAVDEDVLAAALEKACRHAASRSR